MNNTPHDRAAYFNSLSLWSELHYLSTCTNFAASTPRLPKSLGLTYKHIPLPTLDPLAHSASSTSTRPRP